MFGATGLVGGALLELLLAEGERSGLVAPVRRPVPALAGRPRLLTPEVDFDDLAAGLTGLDADQAFVCLGTTMAKAGSEAAFRRVDHDAVLAACRVSLAAGARDLFLVSSLGASRSARGFYLRVKGEVEAAVLDLPFRSIHIFRPSLLTGAREEARPAERLGILLGTLVAPAMVGPIRRYRPIPAETVAAAMATAARTTRPGRWVHESEEIVRLAGRR